MHHDRRSILLRALGAAASLYTLSSYAQPVSEFETLFALAHDNPEILEKVRHVRERATVGAARAVAPRGKRSERQVAEEALRMIVLFEVTSERQYEAKYEQPVWPGGESGATIGVGYDLGYSTNTWLRDDWRAYLDAAILAQLQKVCGKTGDDASRVIPGLRDISVPWSIAFFQFKEMSLPLYTGETLNAVPEASKLSDRSLGALVSLVYNRGASFNKAGDRFKEMRAIKRALESAQYAAIPDLIRQMVRLWDGEQFTGLRHRRTMEAALFQEGLG